MNKHENIVPHMDLRGDGQTFFAMSVDNNGDLEVYGLITETKPKAKVVVSLLIASITIVSLLLLEK